MYLTSGHSNAISLIIAKGVQNRIELAAESGCPWIKFNV
jgi:hypothetical protein